jgi:N-methylhydantoinase A
MSAGAEPGPACYGKGGDQPTITDANLALGRLNPKRPLGEEIDLDKNLAERAVDKIAAHFENYDVVRMADGILKIVVNNMGMAIHEISVQKGYDPREFVLVAFGGAGPLHAVQLAKELGMKKVLVPNIPGNLCALGLLASDTMLNMVRTHMMETRQANMAEILSILNELADEVYQPFAQKGISKQDMFFLRTMDMRYVGQAFELNINVPGEVTAENLELAFYDAYETAYGQADRQEKTELVNIRVSAIHKNPRPALSVKSQISQPSGTEFTWSIRQVYFEETGFVDCKVYERDQLPFGAFIDGPAIIEEFGSTTVIPPSSAVEVDALGNIIIDVFGRKQ